MCTKKLLMRSFASGTFEIAVTVTICPPLSVCSVKILCLELWLLLSLYGGFLFYNKLYWNCIPFTNLTSPNTLTVADTLIMQRCVWMNGPAVYLRINKLWPPRGPKQWRSCWPSHTPCRTWSTAQHSTAAWISPTHLCGGKDYPDLPAFTDRVLSHSSVPAATRHLITLSNSFFCN